jgi:hypothetical protein
LLPWGRLRVVDFALRHESCCVIRDDGGDALRGARRVGLAFVRTRVEGIGVTDVLWVYEASTSEFAVAVVMGVIAVLGEVSLPIAQLAYVVLSAHVPC